MFETTTIVCLALFAVACLCAAAYAGHLAKEAVKSSLELARSTFEAAGIIARSQQEAGVKYATANSQVANIISEQVDRRVASRVKSINAILRPNSQPDLEPIESPPEMPDVYHSITLDDEHEINRENMRIRREGDQYDVRDEYEEI